MKLYAICLVKNEDDVIAQTLTHASQYCDKIFVIDNDSTDRTWGIVQELAKSQPAVAAFAQRSEPYDEGLRWLAYDAHHRELTDEDWWLILDGDEFLAEDPRPVIEHAMKTRADIIEAWQIQFYYTEKDYEAWLAGQDSRDMPVYMRRRYYRIDWQEPRLFRNQTKPNVAFRQSKLLTATAHWATSVLQLKGKVCRQRILNRHYQYRDPAQIEQRLLLRMSTPTGFRHVKSVGSLDWRSVMRSSKDLTYYEDGRPWYFSYAGLRHCYAGRIRYTLSRYLGAARKLVAVDRAPRQETSWRGSQMDEEQRRASAHRDPVHKTTLPALRVGCQASGPATESALVSVIIPTYNRASRLARAIRSVQRQNHDCLEIIVVDDGSNDNTREIVTNLRDPRIRYIRHEQNRGGSAARNTGIRAATGEYVAFLDDDDEWAPEKTAEQLKVLRAYDVVVCTSDGIGKDLHKHDQKKTLELEDLRLGPFGGTGVLMAKAFILKETMFDETLPRGQDWDVFIRIALKHKIGYLNKPYLRYDHGAHFRVTNSALDMTIEELEQQFRVIQKYKDLFGQAWFRRNMCQALMYGFRRRQGKFKVLLYTARRYGAINVARTLTRRIVLQLWESLQDVRRANRSDIGRSAL